MVKSGVVAVVGTASAGTGAVAVAASVASPRTKRTRSPLWQSSCPPGSTPSRIFGPARSTSTPTVRPTLCGGAANRGQADVLLTVIGMGHVQTKDIDAGGDEFRQLVLGIAGRSYGGHDLGLRIARRERLSA